MLICRIVIFAAFPYALLYSAMLGLALPLNWSHRALFLLIIVTSIFPHLRVAGASGHGVDDVYLWLISLTAGVGIAVLTGLLSRGRSFGVVSAIYMGLTLAEIALAAILLRLYGWAILRPNVL